MQGLIASSRYGLLHSVGAMQAYGPSTRVPTRGVLGRVCVCLCVLQTGDNALLLAAQWGHLHMVQTLLGLGMDVNFVNEVPPRDALSMRCVA